MTIMRSPLTPLTVGRVAKNLMRAQGGTSELIVQQYLRNRGYQPHQGEVSAWLALMAQHEGWAIQDYGPFRIYTLPQAA